MNIDSLQAKRALLVTQRDNMLAQVNVASGAIAMIDELLGEVAKAPTRAEVKEALDYADSLAKPSRAEADAKWDAELEKVGEVERVGRGGMTPPAPHRMVPRDLSGL
jgi:hypothetical protein